MSAFGSRPRLLMNFLPVRFEGTLQQVFESSEQIAELRRRLAKSYVVVKLRGTYMICCVPFVTGAPPVGEPTEFGVDGKDLYLATCCRRPSHGQCK
jgi:hypothetical protein